MKQSEYNDIKHGTDGDQPSPQPEKPQRNVPEQNPVPPEQDPRPSESEPIPDETNPGPTEQPIPLRDQ